MKKRILLLLSLLFTLLLTGCAMRTVEEMYALPKRSEEYKELQAAIGRPPGIDILTISLIRNIFRVLSLRAPMDVPTVAGINPLKDNEANESRQTHCIIFHHKMEATLPQHFHRPAHSEAPAACFPQDWPGHHGGRRYR